MASTFSKIAPALSDYASVRQRALGGRRPSEAQSAFPKITIVTVTFNSEKTLQRTFDSIRRQTYPNIEYVVVDGASTDGTRASIERNLDLISTWISEADSGIYDAFNKGVALATGDYIAFLNSDDAYSDDQLCVAMRAIERSGALWVFGDMTLHGFNGRDVYLPGDPDYAAKIRLTMPMLLQITVLAHRVIFAEIGLFRTNYRIASDYDWFLRVALAGIPGVYEPAIHGLMWAGGASTGRQRVALKEGYLISVRNGCPRCIAIPHWSARYLYPNGLPPWLDRNLARLLPVLRLAGFDINAPQIPRLDLPVEAHWKAGLKLSALAAAQDCGGPLDQRTLAAAIDLLSRAPIRSAVVGGGAARAQLDALFDRLELVPCAMEDAWLAFVTGIDALDVGRIGGRFLVLAGDVAMEGGLPKGTLPVGKFGGLMIARSAEFKS